MINLDMELCFHFIFMNLVPKLNFLLNSESETATHKDEVFPKIDVSRVKILKNTFWRSDRRKLLQVFFAWAIYV